MHDLIGPVVAKWGVDRVAAQATVGTILRRCRYDFASLQRARSTLGGRAFSWASLASPWRARKTLLSHAHRNLWGRGVRRCQPFVRGPSKLTRGRDADAPNAWLRT